MAKTKVMQPMQCGAGGNPDQDPGVSSATESRGSERRRRTSLRRHSSCCSFREMSQVPNITLAPGPKMESTSVEPAALIPRKALPFRCCPVRWKNLEVTAGSCEDSVGDDHRLTRGFAETTFWPP